jgi:ribosomal protein L37AE/L43A
MSTKPKEERTCPQCGLAFMPRTSWQVFCTDKCRNNSNADRHVRIERTEWEKLKQAQKELRKLQAQMVKGKAVS